MASPYRRTKLCLEGWFYVMVFCFILSGAVFRQVNLLIFLAGLMLGPLLYNWRYAVETLRLVRVRRTLPRMVSAGEWFTVNLSVTNDRRNLLSYGVVAEDAVRPAGAARGKAAALSQTLVERLEPQSTVARAYSACIPRRGKYDFGPLVVETRFPLGLVEVGMVFPERQSLLVAPQVGKLTPKGRELLGFDPQGLRMLRRRMLDNEGEFYGVREWRAGDSRRLIHWRTVARTNRLAVRQFQPTQREDLTLALDGWLPASPQIADVEALENVVRLTATILAELSREGGTRVSVILAGKTLEDRHGVANSFFLTELLELLAEWEGGEAHAPSEAADRALQRSLGGGNVVFLTSRTLSDLNAAVEAQPIAREDSFVRSRFLRLSSRDESFQALAMYSPIAKEAAAKPASADRTEPTTQRV